MLRALAAFEEKKTRNEVWTYSLQHSPSREICISSASQSIPCILQNLNLHYCVNKSPLFVLILRLMKPVYIFPFYIFKIYFNIVKILYLFL